MSAYLSVNGLCCTLGGTQILDGITISVDEGEFVGLVGPNGCGKSTLLKNIYKTIKPSRDVVFIGGQDIMTIAPKEMAKRASVVAQENSVEFDVEVLEMVMYGRYAHRKFLEGQKQSDIDLCMELLDTVGLAGYENRSFLSLSGGEKQRVLLARALAQQAGLVLLDEPTNHLDVKYQYLLMHILKEQGSTVFSSIHDLNIAALYCDRIIMMKNGRIMLSGPPQEVLTEENIMDIFEAKAEVTKDPSTGKMRIYYLPVQ